MVDNEEFSFSMLDMEEIENSIPELTTNIKDNGLDYVEYGVFDNMGQNLLDKYNTSALHNTIIKTKVNMLLGDEIKIIGVEDDRTLKFLQAVNQDDSMQEMINKLAIDFEIFGLAYIEVIYSNDGFIQELEHIDATKIRWGKKIRNKLNYVMYSDDWSDPSEEQIPFRVFNPKNGKGDKSQIMVINLYTPSEPYYAKPSYFSGYKYITMDYLISDYHENNIKNGFVGTTLIDIPLQTSDNEKRKRIQRDIIKQYTKTKNAGTPIITVRTPGVDNKVSIENIALSDSDKLYEWLSTKVNQQINLSHGIKNEQLVGVSTPGKLGGGQELDSSYNAFFNDEIKPTQQFILSKINKLLRYNGMNDIEILSRSSEQQIEETEKIIDEEETEIKEDIKEEKVEQEIIKNDNDNLSKQFGDTILYNNQRYELKGEIISAKTPVSRIPKGIIFNRKGLYIWTLGHGGDSRLNCPSCVAHAGKVMPIRQCRKIAIPGHTSSEMNSTYTTTSGKVIAPYGTYCEAACTCKLIKIN